MPINEREFHPFLEMGHSIKNSKSLILGTFPVYDLTNPQTEVKTERRTKSGAPLFFYGSVKSQFWGLYSKYIDDSITQPIQSKLILDNLQAHSIAISDVIVSCVRKDFSASDSDLLNRQYNTIGIKKLLDSGVSSILCTSKAVLKILAKDILCKKGKALCSVNQLQSENLQADFLRTIGGNPSLVKGMIVCCFLYNGRIIKCISLPSPSSPQRKLGTFGYDGQHWSEYADKYFKAAFKWLKN